MSIKRTVSVLLAAAFCLQAVAAPRNKLPEILNIAYSKQNDGCHINTIEHFKAAVEAGFNCLKADMQMTSDGVVVLCHDNGFTIDENGRIGMFDKNNNTLICNMTFSEISQLEYNYGKAENGAYPKVCTLEKFTALCRKAGVWMYVTQRNNDQIDATQTELLRILKKNKMTKRCIINNYPARVETCRKIHQYNSKAPVSFTMTAKQPLTKEMVDEIATLAPVVICLNTKNIPTLDPEVMKYATEKGIRVLGWYPKTIEEYCAWKSIGLTGAQIQKIDIR